MSQNLFLSFQGRIKSTSSFVTVSDRLSNLRLSAQEGEAHYSINGVTSKALLLVAYYYIFGLIFADFWYKSVFGRPFHYLGYNGPFDFRISISPENRSTAINVSLAIFTVLIFVAGRVGYALQKKAISNGNLDKLVWIALFGIGLYGMSIPNSLGLIAFIFIPLPILMFIFIAALYEFKLIRYDQDLLLTALTSIAGFLPVFFYIRFELISAGHPILVTYAALVIAVITTVIAGILVLFFDILEEDESLNVTYQLEWNRAFLAFTVIVFCSLITAEIAIRAFGARNNR